MNKLAEHIKDLYVYMEYECVIPEWVSSGPCTLGFLVENEKHVVGRIAITRVLTFPMMLRIDIRRYNHNLPLRLVMQGGGEYDLIPRRPIRYGVDATVELNDAEVRQDLEACGIVL